jgi:hypothetical protein
MIRIDKNDIFRGTTKIGWLTDNHIFDHTGKKIGYTTYDNYVCDEATGKKLAHLNGEFVYNPDTGSKTRLEDVICGIDSPVLSDIQRVAIKIFFGN